MRILTLFLAGVLSVAGLMTAQAEAGQNYHSCALTAAGGVKCWGYNGLGQLGDGTTTARSFPVDVLASPGGPPLTDIVQISLGGTHTCALTSTGYVKCWGYNTEGSLGDGTTTHRSTPVDVLQSPGGPPLSGVAQISAGGIHSCALMAAGGVKCWGGNYYGTLGDGTTTHSSVPVDVLAAEGGPALRGVRQIVAGDIHTCAVMVDGGAKCWGLNHRGELGDGSGSRRTIPVDVLISPGGAALVGIVEIRAGGFHTCAVMTDGGIKCWGSNTFGQLGNGSTADSPTQVDVLASAGGPPITGAVHVVTGDGHSCALMATGAVRCWGQNLSGQLGNGAFTQRTTPVSVLTSPGGSAFGGAVLLSAGLYHNCAELTTGEVQCWGNNQFGQLGDGSLTQRTTPVVVRVGSGGPALAGVARLWDTEPLDLDELPGADAGADFSVNEGHTGVSLHGSGSDPDGDPLIFQWEQVLDGSPQVALAGANTANPTFTAPAVAVGGETLTFRLTVTANGGSATDTVSVTIVNVNHPPVAEAGEDRNVAEGSPVTLHGEASFDIDTDPFTYTWVQIDNGSPAVTLSGANSASPSFIAPDGGSGGSAGVVATLIFTLTVADGGAPDAPAPGYDFSSIEDTVTVFVTNVNNAPVADAGLPQITDEQGAVALSAAGSSDPDSDPLSYSWSQIGGPTVTLVAANTATPTITAPFVDPGGADLTFRVTVDDGYGGTASDTVVVHVQNVNDPPHAASARPTIATLWPPNHHLIVVGITGVTDANNNATITITGVTQDEPTNGLGDGDTAIDAVINSDGTVLLRAERSGTGDGRVYRISFTASDVEGSTSGVVIVTVPRSAKNTAVDSGEIFDSTQ